MYNFIQKTLALWGLLSILGSNAWAQSPSPPRGNGQIRIFNYHLNEYAEIRFREGDRLHPEGMKQVKQILRSRGNQELLNIDPRLIDLIDHLQDHFGADTIEIISAYRDPAFNQKLREEGRNVARESRHMKGEALDIHIDEIREESLRDYLLGLGLGGVGYYGPLDFIHVDFGGVKQWSEPLGGRKLVGVINPLAPIQLSSDKNDYLPEETLLFTWSLADGRDLGEVVDLKLELFRRGQWTPCVTPADPKKKAGLPATSLLCSPGVTETVFGKYRWVYKLKGSEEPVSSNEFYLKKM